MRHGDQGAPAQAYAIRGDGPSVYFCGASGYSPGFAELGRRSPPDVALLPIGGYAPASFRERHMSPVDALYAFEDLRARLMVPIGYGSFALSYERMNDPERWLAELVRTRGLEPYVSILYPGESRVFVGSGGSEVDVDLEGAPGEAEARGPDVTERGGAWERPPGGAAALAATPASR